MDRAVERVRAYFNLEERGSSMSREFIGGLTTFVTMAYIIFVNPAILGDSGGAGMDMGAVMIATVLAAGITSIIMGLFANLPIALAPGMGMNALFSYYICGQLGVPWEKALGIVVISGAIFLLLSLFKFRKKVIDAVPSSLKYGAAAGIGLFIAFIGFKNAGIVVPDANTYVAFGPLSSPPVLLAVFGLVLTGVLVAFGIRGGILIGLLTTGIVGRMLGIIAARQEEGMTIAKTFMKADIPGALSAAFILPILTFLFFDMFDTVGTLMGVTEAAGLVDEKGEIPNAGRALGTDAAGTIIGGLLGTSTTTSYIESAAGVASGARTGLTAVVTGVLFLLSLPLLRFVAIFANSVPMEHTMYFADKPHHMILHLYPATAAALVIVGFQMVKVLRRINWHDLTEGLPAFLTIIIMPLTFSISEGLAVGFVSYVILKMVHGRFKDAHPLLYLISAAIVAGYVAAQTF